MSERPRRDDDPPDSDDVEAFVRLVMPDEEASRDAEDAEK